MSKATQFGYKSRPGDGFAPQSSIRDEAKWLSLPSTTKAPGAAFFDDDLLISYDKGGRLSSRKSSRK